MIPPDTRIAIGEPRGCDTLYSHEYKSSQLAMFAHSPCQYKILTSVQVHHQARNTIIKDFLKSDCEYLLFIDSDMVWEPDSLERAYDLMQNDTVDIVSAIYYTKTEPHLPVIKKMDLAHGVFLVPLEWDNNPFEIDGAGMGFMLLTKKVLERMKYPYCHWGNGLSEDLNFCITAKVKHHFRIWVDPLIKIGHVGQRTITSFNFIQQHKVSLKAWVRESMRLAVKDMKEHHPHWREDLGIHPLQLPNINTQEYWDAIYGKEGIVDNWRTYPDRDAEIVSRLQLQPNSRVMELGCGLGIFADRLFDKFPEIDYSGFDISEVAVKACLAKDVFANIAKVPPVPSDGKPVDLIVAFEFLEHLDDNDRELVIEQVSQAISDTGQAIFSVPDNTFPPDEIMEHRVVFTRESFAKFLREKFNEVKVEKFATRASHKAGYGITNILFGFCSNKKTGTDTGAGVDSDSVRVCHYSDDDSISSEKDN